MYVYGFHLSIEKLHCKNKMSHFRRVKKMFLTYCLPPLLKIKKLSCDNVIESIDNEFNQKSRLPQHYTEPKCYKNSNQKTKPCIYELKFQTGKKGKKERRSMKVCAKFRCRRATVVI